MDKQLTKVGLILIGLFFVIMLVIPYIIPVRNFVASTSPEKFPFQLPSTVDSISLSSMPDDHVVLCYARNGNIYYKESYTRGLSWYDTQPLIIKNANNVEDLFVNVAQAGSSNILLIAWDALINPPNQSSRRAFYAVANLSTSVPTIIYGPKRCYSTGTSIERFPTMAGNSVQGYRTTWLINASGDYNIEICKSNDFYSLGSNSSMKIGTNQVTFPQVVLNSTGMFSLFYLQSNASTQRIMCRDLMTDTNTTILTLSMTSGNITSIDYSITQSNDLVISFSRNSTISDSKENLYYYTSSSNYMIQKQQAIENESTASMLLHTTFSDNQVLTIWLQKAEDNNSANDILYTITDFNMTNKNSTYDSILLAYIMFGCGIFNFFVYLHLKKNGRFEEDNEPLNNIAVTACFITIGTLMLLPFSGFQGEQLGASYADGYIYPAPINLGTIIVIGFVFLFFLVSTPLIDRFWRRDPKIRETRAVLVVEQKPFSWKQEILRKGPHMIMALIIIGFDPVGSYAMQMVAIQKYNQYSFINEGAIIFDYVLRLNNLEIGSYAVKIMMASGIVFLWVLDLHMLLASPTRYFFMKDYMRYASRKKEKSSMADFVVMFASILLMIIVLTFNPAYKLQGMFASFGGFCAICFGDTAGVIFGKSIGKHKLKFQPKKSWEGLIAGAIITFSTSLIFLTLPFALIVMGIYAVVDLITPKVPISDNFLIPLLTALVFLPLLPFVQSPLMGLYMP